MQAVWYRRVGILLAAIILAVGAITALSFGNSAKTQTDNKPNIVFIMTDDQPQSTVKVMPNVRTRIRDVGLNAFNFYVTQSLCCPSRASILRGQYPHNTGVQRNGPPGGGHDTFKPIDGSTIATQLNSSGYKTGFVGKYLNGYECPYKPPGWDYAYMKDDVSNAGEKACENTNMIDYTGQTGNWGDRVEGKSLDFLNRNTNEAGDGPFALFMWTAYPHLGAGDYAARYDGLYSGETVPKPPGFDEADVSDKPQWVKDLPRIGSADTAYLNELYRNQLRESKQTDDSIGKMLDMLRDRGELDNTFVVYMTDNNTHMGEHRWWTDHGAKNTSYEEAANVMFYVRGPGVPAGSTTNELYSNTDLQPTFNRIAGGTPPAYTDGRGILTSWRNPNDTIARTGLLNERALPSAGIPIPTYDAIVTKTHTYTEYDNGEKEYYNRLTDPNELNNSYGSNPPPSSLVNQLHDLENCQADECVSVENR